MSFFPELPDPGDEEEQEYRRDWTGPPSGLIGGVVAWQGVLARTDDLVLWAGHVEVFPVGVAFTIGARVRRGAERRELTMSMFGHAATPGESLRVGAEYADGRRTTDDHFAACSWDDEEEETEPSGPILWPQGGGGGDLETRHGYWLWPAPLGGDLQIVAQWLEQGIAECRVTIPAPLLADAAGRIVEIWPDDVLGRPA